MILPEITRAKALQIAERLRRLVENTRFHLDREDIHVTVSAGLCEFGGEVVSTESLLSAADNALYLAKQRGRNQVVCHRTAAPGKAPGMKIEAAGIK